MELKIGLRLTRELTVDETMTADVVGSGGVAVFATPNMILGMESVSEACVRDAVGDGNVTVGTLLDVRHLAATPVGMKVRFECELREIEGRRLVFSVFAFDEVEKIGEGTHERFIVNREKFVKRALEKKKA